MTYYVPYAVAALLLGWLFGKWTYRWERKYALRRYKRAQRYLRCARDLQHAGLPKSAIIVRWAATRGLKRQRMK